MKPDAGFCSRNSRTKCGFVSGEVVEDDVDLLIRRTQGRPAAGAVPPPRLGFKSLCCLKGSPFCLKTAAKLFPDSRSFRLSGHALDKRQTIRLTKSGDVVPTLLHGQRGVCAKCNRDINVWTKR